MNTRYTLQKLVGCLALLLISAKSNAQFVTIPDPNFVTYLQTNFPSGISGNQMDTTDLSVISVQTVAVNNLGISDLTGIQYFKSLQSLAMYNNGGLTMIPNLPSSLLSLDCMMTGITHISNLPPMLQYLDASSNLIDTIDYLPSTLSTLYLMNNPSLNFLPALPASLTVLRVEQCALGSLPSLPSSLWFLDCRFNNNIWFSCLPVLPDSLITLLASGNMINCLPNIPTNGSFTSDIGTTVCNNTQIQSITNVSCGTSCTGSITVTGTSGTALDYIFSNGYSSLNNTSGTATASNVCAGNYFVTVQPTSGGGCPAQINFDIDSSLVVTISTTTNVTCFGGNNGILCANVTGGTPPYSFNWSNSTVTQCINNLTAGIYTVTVYDANSCSGTATVTVSEPPPLTVSAGSDIVVCNGSLVNICPVFTGGGGFYTYLWSVGSIFPCLNVNVSGQYIITVTDQNGCYAMDTVVVTYTASLNFLSLQVDSLPVCGLCNGVATPIVTGTTGISYLWVPGNNTAFINTQLCDSTNNTLYVTDINGCVDSVNFNLSCRSVWPGDANNDGQADNTDLLAIGIGYGTTGPKRTNISIAWQAEVGADWADSLVSGTNYKHIDCNGDGGIGDDDTTAIIQNFGLTHTLRPAIIPMVLTDPPLYFDIQIDSASVDTMLQIPLMLGTSAIPADSVYGIAFTVSYDTALVKADSVTMDFINCWMNSATGHTIGIGVNDPLNGKLYGAVTRTSHTDTSGYGELGRLGIVTVDNISARMSSLYSDTLVLGISDVTLITHDEQYKTVNIIVDSLIINDNTVGTIEHTGSFSLSVYPNPANRFLFIEYDQQILNAKLSLKNVLNQKQNINYHLNNGKAIVDLSNVANGIYLLSVVSEKGIATRKINVLKP